MSCSLPFQFSPLSQTSSQQSSPSRSLIVDRTRSWWFKEVFAAYPVFEMLIRFIFPLWLNNLEPVAEYCNRYKDASFRGHVNKSSTLNFVAGKASVSWKVRGRITTSSTQFPPQAIWFRNICIDGFSDVSGFLSRLTSPSSSQSIVRIGSTNRNYAGVTSVQYLDMKVPAYSNYIEDYLRTSIYQVLLKILCRKHSAPVRAQHVALSKTTALSTLSADREIILCSDVLIPSLFVVFPLKQHPKFISVSDFLLDTRGKWSSALTYTTPWIDG